MRLSPRLLITWFSLACLLMSGCGGRADETTLAIATQLPAADIEIEAAQRTDVLELAGRPDSGFATATEVVQVYLVTEDNLDEVLGELRAAVEADGWVMDTVYDEGVWTTATREFDDRRFYLQSSYTIPDQEGNQRASLSIKECGRGNSPCAEELP